MNRRLRNVALLLTPRPASEWRIKSTPAPDAFKRDARKHPRLFFDSAQWNALRFGAQDFGGFALDDQFAHALIDLHDFVECVAASVAGLVAVFAAAAEEEFLAFDVFGAQVHFHQRLFRRRIPVLALRTDGANEALRDDGVERRRH